MNGFLRPPLLQNRLLLENRRLPTITSPDFHHIPHNRVLLNKLLLAALPPHSCSFTIPICNSADLTRPQIENYLLARFETNARSDKKETFQFSCLEESDRSHAAHDDSGNGGSRDRSTDLQALDVGGVAVVSNSSKGIAAAAADPWIACFSAPALISLIRLSALVIEIAISVHFRAFIIRPVGFFKRQFAGPLCRDSGGEGSGENGKGSGAQGHHLECKGWRRVIFNGKDWREWFSIVLFVGLWVH